MKCNFRAEVPPHNRCCLKERHRGMKCDGEENCVLMILAHVRMKEE